MHFNWLPWLKTSILGIQVYEIGIAFMILLTTLIIKKIFNNYLMKLFETLSRRTKSDYDDLLLKLLKGPLDALILTIGIFYALFALNLPAEPYNLPSLFRGAFRVAISVIAVWAIYRLSSLLTILIQNIISKADETVADQFAPLITQSLRITILALGIILIIQNLGYSVGSLLAGLGIGGLAVALAAQDTLANLFGTFVLIADRPFKVGDWVQFRDVDGDVESIGFRSTKIRTWSKSLKIVPNKLLTSEIIENWSAMPKRRVKMTIGVTYDSHPQKLETLRSELENILINDPGVDQTYFLVYFTDFGASALEFFIYYFTKTTVWKEYLQTRERINIKFMKAVSDQGLSFAFPSQTIYMGSNQPEWVTSVENKNGV